MYKVTWVTLTFSLLTITGVASAHGSHLYNSHTHNTYTKTSGPYIGIGVGKLKLDIDTPFQNYDETTNKVFAGYQFNKKIALEVQHTKMDGTTSIAGIPANYDVNVTGVSTVFTPFNSHRVVPFGKVGITKVRAKAKIPLLGLSSSANSTGASAGIGVIIPISKKLKLRAEYEKFDSDVDMLSLSTSYHF